jgi:hypothetical protein
MGVAAHPFEAVFTSQMSIHTSSSSNTYHSLAAAASKGSANGSIYSRPARFAFSTATQGGAEATEATRGLGFKTVC